MLVYRLELTLHEKVFFASREIDELFQTEPVLGNYALTYALGLAVTPYRLSEREDRPYYREDFSVLNDTGIYVTPGTPLNAPTLEVERFNGMVESYWYKMANNAVVSDLAVRLDGARAGDELPAKGTVTNVVAWQSLRVLRLRAGGADAPALHSSRQISGQDSRCRDARMARPPNAYGARGASGRIS